MTLKIGSRICLIWNLFFYTAYAGCPNFNGGALISRSSIDTVGLTAINTGNPITCNGFITGWRFFPAVSVEFVALVMRPYELAVGKYAVVMQTVIPKQQLLNQPREFTLHESDHIAVQPGDFIGLHFETALLPYDDEGTMFVLNEGVNQNTLVPHTVHTIQQSTSLKTYSFQAVLKDSYLPCHILTWPLFKSSPFRASTPRIFMDDWNKVRCPGTITGWKFLTGSSGDIFAYVFRAVDSANNVYEIVSKTTIPEQAEKNIVIEFPLSYSERINVLPGDKIGLAYTGSPLYYDASFGMSLYKYFTVSNPGSFGIGSQITFDNFSIRRFRFDAILDHVKHPNFAHQSNSYLNGYKLQNNNIMTLTGTAMSSCFTKCIENAQCKSINYKHDQRKCELNSAVSDQDSENFEETTGETYIEINHVTKTSMEGKCTSVDCGVDSICISVPESSNQYVCMCVEAGYMATDCPSPECLENLGMQSKSIHDGQITASSMTSSEFRPQCARLNLNQNDCTGGWSSDTSDKNSWIQIHLLTEHNITKIATEGHNNKWIRSFLISFVKVNQIGQNFILNGHGIPKVFYANREVSNNDERGNSFNPVIQAVAIRVHPKTWENGGTMRFELYGCRIGDEWVRVFKGIAMTEQSIYNAWLNGDGTSDYYADQFLSSKNFYRNNVIFDGWPSFNIQKVKLTVYSAFDKELISVVFDGVDSDTASWFSRDRIESSPWSDILTAPCNYFSISGHVGRKFFMNSVYNGCPGDKGWFMVNEHSYCKEFDGFDTKTRILYSRTKTKEVYATGDIGTAKVMTVDVKIGW